MAMSGELGSVRQTEATLEEQAGGWRSVANGRWRSALQAGAILDATVQHADPDTGATAASETHQTAG